jgi:hypothetical protein
LTPSETAQILAELKAAYPRQEITPDTLKIYAAHLLPFEVDQVQAAVREHTRESRFFPTVAELLERVAEETAGVPSPPVAWAEVSKELRRVGHTGAPSWSHELIREAVVMFGWRRLCETSTSSLATDRARFIELYEELRRHEIRRSVNAGAETTARALGAGPLRLSSGEREN